MTGQQVELHLAVLIGQSQRKSLLNQHPYLEDKQLFRSDTGDYLEDFDRSGHKSKGCNKRAACQWHLSREIARITTEKSRK